MVWRVAVWKRVMMEGLVEEEVVVVEVVAAAAVCTQRSLAATTIC